MQYEYASPQDIFQNGGEGRCEASLRRKVEIANLHSGKFFTPFGAKAMQTLILTGYWSKMAKTQILSIIAPKSENHKSAFRGIKLHPFALVQTGRASPQSIEN